ncbi:MAG TPA: hypothetical protein VJ418_13155 [Streptosporangiaceae bacterium]|nr:hypothetical protein [Streptosporangiaceae bacterium]
MSGEVPFRGGAALVWYWRGASYPLVRMRPRRLGQEAVNPGIHLVLARSIPGFTWYAALTAP